MIFFQTAAAGNKYDFGAIFYIKLCSLIHNSDIACRVIGFVGFIGLKFGV